MTYAALRGDVREVLDAIAMQGNLNLILDSGVLESTSRVTLSLNDVPAGDAIEAVAKMFDLKVTRERHDTLRISRP